MADIQPIRDLISGINAKLATLRTAIDAIQNDPDVQAKIDEIQTGLEEIQTTIDELIADAQGTETPATGETPPA